MTKRTRTDARRSKPRMVVRCQKRECGRVFPSFVERDAHWRAEHGNPEMRPDGTAREARWEAHTERSNR